LVIKRNEMLNIEDRAQEEGLLAKTILKEYLQISILEYLYSVPESDVITFQGGTCLRLLYGGPRYSDDLDFVVTDAGILPAIFKKVSSAVEKLSPLFEGKLRMRIQKESGSLVRWKLYYEPAENDERVSVSVEFAKYPAYTSQLLPLKVPKGYPAAPLILVKAETEQEILADKINAAATRKYLKGRDIFDIWLLKSKGIPVDAGLVEKKFRDYSSPKVKIEERIKQFSVERVRQDLENYLPRAYREKFQREGYGILLEAAGEVAAEVDRQMG
jgi:predicted nucleotidyltransferase component of viral defense system